MSGHLRTAVVRVGGLVIKGVAPLRMTTKQANVGLHVISADPVT